MRMSAMFVLCTAVIGCSAKVPSDSACRGLVYTDAGPSRIEYAPCAGEMVKSLDEVATHSNAAFKGDSASRSKGQESLGRAKALFDAAGGRKLLERWNDRTLMNFNLAVSNVLTVYTAFYMIRVQDEGQFAAETRSAAENELRKATRRYQEARAIYAGLR